MTPFNRQDPSVLVPAVLSGPSGRIALTLALDTGASVSTLPRRAIVETGHNPFLFRSATFFNTERNLRGELVVVRRLEALGHVWENVEVLILDLPDSSGIDGLIGLDLLRDRRLTIDFRDGVIDLE